MPCSLFHSKARGIRKTGILLAAGLLILGPRLYAFDYAGFFKKAVGFSGQTRLSDTRIGEGLKEALRVGTERAVEAASRKDGYFAVPSLHIPLPEKVRAAEAVLRKAGLGPKLDEFELSLNRAAEKAAPKALDIFTNAILEMSFEDARKIYGGPDNAATQYFESKTAGLLKSAYGPVIEKTMQDYGVTRQYQALVGKVPFARNIKSLKIEDYVTANALQGLFRILGEEEKIIRRDPAARASDILREVFGKFPSAL